MFLAFFVAIMFISNIYSPRWWRCRLGRSSLMRNVEFSNPSPDRLKSLKQVATALLLTGMSVMDAPCRSWCCTPQNLHCSMATSTEHLQNCSPSLVLVMFPYEWSIHESDEITKTNKQTHIHCGHFNIWIFLLKRIPTVILSFSPSHEQRQR